MYHSRKLFSPNNNSILVTMLPAIEHSVKNEVKEYDFSKAKRGAVVS